jgi:chaperonin cofactor prefoldin
MTSPATLKAKIAVGVSDLEKAQEEITQLLQELNAVPLNKSALQTGLKNLQETVSELSAHIPTFGN